VLSLGSGEVGDLPLFPAAYVNAGFSVSRGIFVGTLGSIAAMMFAALALW
jgi:hypothetical protein